MLKIQDPTSRMAKWICTLSDFDFTSQYIQGKCNGVADFLSRFTTTDQDIVKHPYNFCLLDQEKDQLFTNSELLEKLRQAQKTDSKCIQIANKLCNKQQIFPRYLEFYFKDDLLVCTDIRETNPMLKKVKLVVPKVMVPQVFALTHESLVACHQAFQKTIDRIREHFYWPGMSAHVRNLVDSCVSCQQRRAHKANQHAPLQRMPTPEYPNARVHLDILGPLPVTLSGNKFIIHYVDAFTKWPEAYAVSSITSDVVADTLADFISRHGCPSYIVTDKGSNLLSEGIENVYKLFGIKHRNTSSYHPAGNGQVERGNRTLINALSHIVNENQLDWDTKLKFALLAIRTAVHAATKLTPAVVTYGRNLHLPYELLSSPPSFNYNESPSFCEMLIPALQKVYLQVYEKLVKAAESQENYRDKTAVVKNLKVGDSVWLFTPAVKPNLSKKLTKLNSGPYTIVQKINEVNFKIALESKPASTQVVHVDRLTLVKNRLSFDKNTVENIPAAEGSSTNPPNVNNDVQVVEETPDDPLSKIRRRRKFFPFPIISSIVPQTIHSPISEQHAPAPSVSEQNRGDIQLDKGSGGSIQGENTCVAENSAEKVSQEGVSRSLSEICQQQQHHQSIKGNANNVRLQSESTPRYNLRNRK